MVTRGSAGPIVKADFVAIVGPPSCGKTTLIRALRRTAECVSHSLQIADFSRHIRAWHLNPDNDSPHRELAESHEVIRAQGNMIPDEDMEKLILYYLYAKERIVMNEAQMLAAQIKRIGIHRFICAGWPRNKEQIESMLANFKNPIIVVLDITYEKSNEMRLKRIEEAKAQGQVREDDEDVSAFENRWHIYRTITEPALKAYTGMMIRVDSSMHLEKKAKLVIRQCIPTDQEIIRASMLSKIISHPKVNNGRPVTKATEFIDHIELGRPLTQRARPQLAIQP